MDKKLKFCAHKFRPPTSFCNFSDGKKMFNATKLGKQLFANERVGSLTFVRVTILTFKSVATYMIFWKGED